jgi:Glu-tRNA(Gln) amidotransferase subunit E-like FAD-binding protein
MILQFHHEGRKPALEEVRALFGLEAAEVDESYGVVGTDPAKGIYVVLVKPSAIEKVRERLAKRPKHPAEGLFANTRIDLMEG